MSGALFSSTHDVGSDMHAHAHMHTYTHSARVTLIVSCLNACSLTNQKVRKNSASKTLLYDFLEVKMVKMEVKICLKYL